MANSTALPATIGDLSILAELGTGARSRVLHVRDGAGREFALKIVPNTLPADLKYIKQARHEYRVGQLLDHPNLIKVHHVHTERDWFFRTIAVRLLLEFAPGKPLDRVPPLALGELVDVFEQIASALVHMHARGVCHADIKPGNVILGPTFRVKLIDYGLANLKEEPRNRMCGTPEYMSPETHERSFTDERSDIFSFGATMYRLVTRQFVPAPPLGLANPEREYRRALVPVAAVCPTAPAVICELIHACIDYDPRNRPASAAEVHEALRHMIARTGNSNVHTRDTTGVL